MEYPQDDFAVPRKDRLLLVADQGGGMSTDKAVCNVPAPEDAAAEESCHKSETIHQLE